MTDSLASLICFINNPIVFGLIIVIGYLGWRKESLLEVAILLLFTMVYNLWLKELFRIPLGWKDGWAFPSGHMHIAVVCLGYWAATSTSITLRLLLLSSLALFGYSIIQLGYHQLADVLGALFFGSTTLTLYFSRRAWFQTNLHRAAQLALIASYFFLFLMKDKKSQAISEAFQIAQGSLWGLFLGIFFARLFSITPHGTLLQKLFIGSLSIILSSLILYFLAPTNPSLISLHFFLLSLWITVGTPLLLTGVDRSSRRKPRIS